MISETNRHVTVERFDIGPAFHVVFICQFLIANNAVREIRSRVGLPYSDKSGDALMAAIRQERKVELACEGFYY
ncbi:RagB/SusD family nutrient uptake outer membrane protein [Bacteroides faecis]|nr:RagB/SusD family nutrient uptake outer membrane protein [Bacteroides faecis]